MLNSRTKQIIIAILGIGLGIYVGVTFVKNQQIASAPSDESASSTLATSSENTTGGTGTSPAPSKPATTGGTASKPKTVVAATAIVTPATNESWLLGKTHEIRWTKQTGFSGAVALVDATSKSIVGWIAPSLSGQQVTYNWDTTSLLMDRVNPLKKNVAPGKYTIRVVFDGRQADVESAAFNIISSGSEKLLSRYVSLDNRIFQPNYLTVKKGEQVVIVNKEGQLSHTITMSGVTVATLSPGQSYVFNTAQVAAGSYEMRLMSNTLAKLTLVVE